MSTNGINSAEDVDTSECDGEKVVTMMDVLQEQEEFEEDANAVLGASDDKNCTYQKGYIKRQAIYACLTCCDEARSDPTKRAGVCLACSLTCHENHELIELYTKRNFRCDCGNPKFNSHPCQFMSNKTELNEDNQYNQNFSGLYCICHRPYPDPENPIEDEMIQCIICEDWLHSAHLEAIVPTNEQYAEMVCKECMNKNEFLHDYSDFAVNTESTEVDIITNNDTGVTTTDVNIDSNKSQNQVLLNGNSVSSEIKNNEQNNEVMDVGSPVPSQLTNDDQNMEVMEVDSSIKVTKEDEIAIKNSNVETNEEANDKEEESSDKTQECINKQSQETSLQTDNIDEEITSGTDNTVKLDETNKEVDVKLTAPKTVQVGLEEVSGNESGEKESDSIKSDNNLSEPKINESSVNLSSEFDSNTITENDIEQIEKSTPENLLETEVDTDENKKLDENGEETKEPVSNKTEDDGKEQTEISPTNENNVEASEGLGESEKSVLDSAEKSTLDSTNDSKLNFVNESHTVIESIKADEENKKSTEPTSIENVDIEMTDDDVIDKVEAGDTESASVSIPVAREVSFNKEEETESAAIKSINISEEESLSTKDDDKLKSVSAAASGTDSEVLDNETADQSSDKIQDLENTQVMPNTQENKRKLSPEESDAEVTIAKKAKLDKSKQCVKPKHTEKRFKGASFWPSNFRQKLCTCSECISMYKDLSVLFLIDPEDTVTAYETLGKEKINGAPVSQYEKGLEALSSLDRIQQINALTEYNKMRDKLLDFLKSFKDRKEIVKEEDIKAFFAGMKPKREPDGVYFCR